MRVWRKSTFSGTGPDNDCVEVSVFSGAIALRESDEPGVVITTTSGSLRTLIRLLKVRGAGVG
ncbi:DUF397 domain-containing protein [Streptomyces albireticuli]|uniref:DUF397 domain-containing protein n=1 Tax=Streptomyces albireticuli TaxID=1940 RepID=UPI0036CAE277